MNMNLLYTLACVLIIPLIPAFLLYKYLPAKTAVTGPFKGLNVKLSGAFSGYFLLVLLAIGLSTIINNNELQDLKKENENLKASLNQNTINQQTWTLKGKIDVDNPELTKIFVYEKNMHLFPTGVFNVDKIILDKEKGKINVPEAICFYHKTKGYKVLNLDQQMLPNDMQKYNVKVDTATNMISIGNPIIFDNLVMGKSYQ